MSILLYLCLAVTTLAALLTAITWAANAYWDWADLRRSNESWPRFLLQHIWKVQVLRLQAITMACAVACLWIPGWFVAVALIPAAVALAISAGMILGLVLGSASVQASPPC